MFDIGFMELLLISIVALLVLGPDKLPHAIRTTALWLGRARRSFNKAKSEIEQQLNTDEIRRQLHNESILKDLEEAKNKANQLAKETSDSLSALEHDVSSSVKGVTARGNEPEGADDADDAKTTSPPDSSAEPGTGPDSDPKSEPGPEPKPKPDRVAEDTSGSAAKPSPGDSDEQLPEPASGTKTRPVTDFYNNPDAKVVTLKDGAFSVPEKPAADKGKKSDD